MRQWPVEQVLDNVRLGGVVLLVSLAWMSPAPAQDVNCMWGQDDVLCQSSRAAKGVGSWFQNDGPGRRQDSRGSRSSPHDSAQDRLIKDLKEMGVLERGWNERPASVDVGRAMAENMRRMDALRPSCRNGSAAACVELRRLERLEAQRSRAIRRGNLIMQGENERLDRENRMRKGELERRYRTQATELRGLADRYEMLAREAFLRDDFSTGRRYRSEAETARRQARELEVR